MMNKSKIVRKKFNEFKSSPEIKNGPLYRIWILQ